MEHLNTPFIHISRQLDQSIMAALNSNSDHTIQLQMVLNAVTTRFCQHLKSHLQEHELNVSAAVGLSYSETEVQIVISTKNHKHALRVSELLENLLFQDNEIKKESLPLLQTSSAFALMFELLCEDNPVDQQLMTTASDMVMTLKTCIQTGLNVEEAYEIVLQERASETISYAFRGLDETLHLVSKTSITA